MRRPDTKDLECDCKCLRLANVWGKRLVAPSGLSSALWSDSGLGLVMVFRSEARTYAVVFAKVEVQELREQAVVCILCRGRGP